MPASQQHITSATPMGANLVGGGATFRVWAPRARKVHVCGEFNGWAKDESSLLVKNADGVWTGFVGGAREGERYKFFVVGEGAGNEGFKRDPYARDLTREWPDPDCILRSAGSFPWQDWSWRPPEFRDLVIYQFHVGTFYGPHRERRVATLQQLLVELARELGATPPRLESLA